MTKPEDEYRKNSFGFLRLFFASLVILSHTPELYDGNRDREILTNLFGSMSFGELAVDGFFFISGYLISASYLNSRSPFSYLKKRVFRIYPGFIAAYLICIFLVAPLGGGVISTTPEYIMTQVVRIALLQPPLSDSAFGGTPYPDLNGAMWTIAYEFKCYLLILALGLFGILNRKRVVLCSAIALILLSCFMPEIYQPFNAADVAQMHAHSFSQRLSNLVIGEPRTTIRFAGIFLCGTSYQLFKHHIRIDRKWIAASLVAFVAFMFSPSTANAAMAIFGGYLILASASLGEGFVTSRINSSTDVSYGVYLYAWPVTKLILWYWPGLNIVIVGVMTIIGAVSLGMASWFLIEHPVMARLKRKPRPDSPVAA
jgi:peptidoglycan/LPS O-acetylase OafA/YrhL